MEVTWWVAQGIGGIAFVISVLMYQLPKRRQIHNGRIAASSAYAVHLAMLGAWSGSVMNIVAVVRTLVFRERIRKKWASSSAWLYFFIGIAWVFTYLTWAGSESVLPGIGLTLGTVTYWVRNPTVIRILSFVVTPFWFLYGYIVASYPLMAVEIFIAVSVMIGIYRFDILKQKPQPLPID